jgi:hypothetical protein
MEIIERSIKGNHTEARKINVLIKICFKRGQEFLGADKGVIVLFEKGTQ